MDDFITVKQAANYLGVSKMTIYRMVNNEALKSIRIGRSIRIVKSSWRAYLASLR